MKNYFTKVMTYLHSSVRDQWKTGSNLVSHNSQCDVYSLGHAVNTLTAVPRLSQPFTLYGMAEQVLYQFLVQIILNNEWWMAEAYQQTRS